MDVIKRGENKMDKRKFTLDDDVIEDCLEECLSK